MRARARAGVRRRTLGGLRRSRKVSAYRLSTTQCSCSGGGDNDTTSSNNDNGSGSLTGAVTLIVGAAVGVGSLSLPEEVDSVGFVYSSLLDVTPIYLLLLSSALFIAEVNAQMLHEDMDAGKARRTITLTEMARRSFGPRAADFASLLYGTLGALLIVSYTDKAGSALSAALPALPQPVAGPLFDVSIASIICVGGVSAADVLNRIGTTTLLLAYGALIIACARSSDPSLLLQPPVSWTEPVKALPVCLLSLSFHDFIGKVLCDYLRGDIRTMRRAIVIGATFAYLLFEVWDAAALSQFKSGFRIELLEQSKNPVTRAGSDFFAIGALSTSFVSSFLGLSEATRATISDAYTRIRGNRPTPVNENFLCATTVLVAPLIINEVFPGLFLRLSTAAGGYLQSILFAFGPAAVALRVPDGAQERTLSRKRTIAILMLCMSAGVFVSQVLQDAALL